MKKIAIIISSLKIGGGAEGVVSRLSYAMSRVGYSVHILTFYNYPREHSSSGHRESLNESSNERKLLKLFRRAYLIRNFCIRHDIQITISFMPEASFPLILSKLMNNKSKIIVSERISPHRKPFLYKMGIRMLYPFADHIVAVAKAAAEVIKAKFRLKNVTTIYNPIDLERSLRLQQGKVPLKYNSIFDKSGFVFTAIGRLVPQKNHEYLIKSFRDVATRYPKAKLVILGDGKLRDYLNLMVERLGLRNKVFLLGNQDNVYPFLKSSDCFILSSLWEGFPNVLTEALSANLPVISTDCLSGPREILTPELDICQRIGYPYFGKYGILVSSDEKDLLKGELSNIMIRMISDSSLRARYSHGIERLSEFQAPNLVKEWKKLMV